MKEVGRKVLSVILIGCLIFPYFSTVAYAVEAERASEQLIKIMGSSDQAITVKDKLDGPTGPEVYGSLELYSKYFSIKRDYAQACMVEVHNPSDVAQEFYLETDNPYDDLAIGFIDAGSKDHPTIIGPQESIQVELSVFAQNAERSSYYIPVSVYVSSEGEFVEDTQTNIKLSCELPTLDLGWTHGQPNESTLRQDFTITNHGGDIADLTVSASDELDEYLSFSPAIANLQLKNGDQVSFSVRPDLAKMKRDGVSKLSGTLVASSAGKTSVQEVEFDTKGKEITVTTMGQLALKQDGNPFSKFEVVEDSVKASYVDEIGQAHQLDSNTTFEEAFGDGSSFDVTISYALDLGVSEMLPVNFNIKSRQLGEDETAPIDDTPVLTENANGSFSLTVKTVLTAEEYAALLEDISGESGIETLIIEPSGGQQLVEMTFDFNTVTGWAGLGSPGLGMMGDVYDLVSMIGTSVAMDHDPDYNESDRTAYKALAACKASVMLVSTVVSIAFPGASLPISIASFALNKLISSFMSDILANPSLLQELYGSQCTNRGYVESDFYAPDYSTSSGSRPRMHATSRMYGNGYVNSDETTYDILLNGESVGTTETTGLTEVAIAEIPTDNLKPGEKNTLTFDYDTYPGSYSVTTDTEIIIEYPADTEIGYIGSPDDLQEVRALPDFCIYPESIRTLAESPIVSETSGLSFTVYNRGSRGGWFKVTCTDASNSSVLYQSGNEYLEAFSSETISIDEWAPAAEQTNIEITVESTSVDLVERDDSNNSAVTTVTARKREVPSIGELQCGTVVEGYPFSAVVNVSDYEDLIGASFTLDGESLDESVTGPVAFADAYRYSLTLLHGLSAGEHVLAVTVSYETGSGVQEVSKSFDITVGAQQYGRIYLPEGYTNPEFTLLRYGLSQSAEFEQAEDGSYRFALTPDMVEYSEEYQVVVACSEGIFVEDMSAKIHLDDSNFRTLSFEVPEGSELSTAKIETIELGDSNCYANIPLPTEGSVKLTPGKYSVNLAGTVDGIDFSSYVDVDLSESDQVLTIGDYVRKYEFQIVGSDGQWFSPRLLIHDPESGYWNQMYLDNSFDVTTGLLSCWISDSFQLSDLNEADAAYILVSSSNAAFLVQVAGGNGSEQQSPVVLNQADLNRVTVASASEDWSIMWTSVNWNDVMFQLYGNELFLPDGAYDFTVTLERNGVSLASSITKEVTEDCTLAIDEVAVELHDVAVSWPEPFSQVGSVYVYSDTGFSISEYEFTSGDSLPMEKGPQNVTLDLQYGDCYFNIFSRITAGPDTDELTVGNEFTGNLHFSSYSEPYAGDLLSAWISSPCDDYGNLLQSVYGVGNIMKGVATFTDVEDGQRVLTTEFSTDYYGSLSVPVPEEPGTYTMSIELVVGDGGQEEQPVTVTFDTRGGSAIEAVELTAGAAVSRPADPIRTGYTFAGWFTDTALTQAYDFALPVTQDMVLYAKWTPNESQDTPVVTMPDSHPVTVPDNIEGGSVSVDSSRAEAGDEVALTVKPDEGQKVNSISVVDSDGNEIDLTDKGDGTYVFTMPDSKVTITVDFICDGGDQCTSHEFPDVDHDQWYHEVVDWALENKIMNGYDDGTFGPDDKLYREQAAAVLYNYLGEGDTSAPAASLSDVDQAQWYAVPLNWALENSIMNGYDGTDRFGVGDALTREQFCAVVANAVGARTSEADLSVLDAFPDAEEIGDWARPSVAWAVEMGLLNGVELSDGTRVLSAMRDITRAEMAAMMFNAVESGVLIK